MLGGNPEEGKVDDVGERKGATAGLMSWSKRQSIGSGGEVEQSLPTGNTNLSRGMHAGDPGLTDMKIVQVQWWEPEEVPFDYFKFLNTQEANPLFESGDEGGAGHV